MLQDSGEYTLLENDCYLEIEMNLKNHLNFQ